MKSYPRLFQKLFCEPLMLHGSTRLAFETALIQRMTGEGPSLPVAAAIEDDMTPRNKRVERIYQTVGKVAVISIDGVIDKRVSAFDMECYGGVDLADVDAALAHAQSDPRIEKIVLDIASPGGSVIGVQETYSRILALTETKEVHAFINSMACSAGYYLASACDLIAAAPSSIVGSIGVYIALLDASRYYENQGLAMNFIQGGKWKTMGTEWKPLADEERARLQERVDASYAQFKAAVNARRPQVQDETMQGQWMDATEGQALGLVDELTVATLDEYVTSLLAL